MARTNFSYQKRQRELAKKKKKAEKAARKAARKTTPEGFDSGDTDGTAGPPDGGQKPAADE